MRATAVLLAGLAVLAGLGPAAAGASASSTIDGSYDGPGWAGVSVADTGGSGSMTLEVRGGERIATGILLLDHHRFAVGPSTFVVDIREGTRVTADASPATELDVDQRRGGAFAVNLRVGFGWRGFSDDVTLVAWTAGEVARTDWTVHGGSGASTLDTTQGEGTFLSVNGDMGSGAELWSNRNTTRATLAEDAFTVERSLVGAFHDGDAVFDPREGFPLDPGGDSIDLMHADTPEGREDCPCTFGADPAGTYELFAAGAGTGDRANLVFTGADALLPAPAR